MPPFHRHASPLFYLGLPKGVRGDLDIWLEVLPTPLGGVTFQVPEPSLELIGATEGT